MNNKILDFVWWFHVGLSDLSIIFINKVIFSSGFNNKMLVADDERTGISLSPEESLYL